MRKLVMRLLVSVLTLSVLGAGVVAANEKDTHHKKPTFNEVELSEEQLQELKVLHEDLINQRKGIINKYVEFGVLSEEDAKKMKEHLDMFLQKMEEGGFIPKWDKHHKKHKDQNEG